MKDKVLLINPKLSLFITNELLRMPIGILYVGSYLREKGYKCDMIDCMTNPNYNQEYLSKVKNYDIIGFTVMTQQIKEALRMSKIAKQHGKTVVWGGVHPSLFPSQCEKNENIDKVIVGEGELKFESFINNIEESTSFVDIEDINQLPMIDLTLLPDCFWEKLSVFSIHSSRGCPYRCEFCINPKLKNFWRGVSAEHVIRQVKNMEQRLGIKKIVNLEDECFFTDRERTIQILQAFKKEGYTRENGFRWRADSRADYFRKGLIDDEILKLCYETGCHTISMGAESGSQKMLDFIKKDILVEDIRFATKKLTEFRIRPRFAWMIGIPGETKEELMQTLNLIDELYKINPRIVCNGPTVYRPYPGGELDKVCESYGWKYPETVEGWIDYNEQHWNYIPISEYPWIDKKNVYMLEMIEPVARWANRPITKESYNTAYILNLIYVWISKLRWKYKYFGMPIDYKLAMWYLKKNMIIKNYGKKIVVGIIGAIVSFFNRYLFLNIFNVHWFKTNIIINIFGMHLGFYLDRKIKYQSDSPILMNYGKKILSLIFSLTLSSCLWWIMIDKLRYHWILTHIFSGIIVLFVFNSTFIFEYITRYQRREHPTK